MIKKMRTGITTGTCAAAATKASLLAWSGKQVSELEVTSPQGKVIKVKVASSTKTACGGRAIVLKDSGDDPDITNGTEIHAEVAVTPEVDIKIKAGLGVGIVTKPGLSVTVGQPAINPGPRQMIIQAVRDILKDDYGAIVTISIPEGEKLAKRTLNSTLGIVGGLSIIGTTGIIEPMSEEAFKNSLAPQISVVKALGYNDIVFVPGKIGQDIAINRYGLPQEVVVQTSNFVGFMLENAVHYGIERVLLFGHTGKLVKVAGGIFHTHNRVADARLEILAANIAILGAPQTAIEEILACTTTEAASEVIDRYELIEVYNLIAEKASLRAKRYVFGDLEVGTVMTSLSGKILGMDDGAKNIGGSLGWNIKL